MERYDGKTKRDDYIKYGCIALAVCVILGGLIWFTRFMKQRRTIAYDYTVVIASEEAFSADMIQDLQSVIGNIVGDRNGDDAVNVSVEVLRLTDVSSAKQADREAEDAYGDAVLAGEESAVNQAKFSGLSGDEDFSRMLLLMNTGEVDLFLLSDQPRGGFQGAATTFCQQGYFAELPDECASEENPYGCDLSQAPFWEELGIEDVAFYGCILDSGSEKQFRQGISVLEQLKNAHVTLW